MRFVSALLLVLVFVSLADAGGGRRSRRYQQWQPAQQAAVLSTVALQSPATEATRPTGKVCENALDEVNAERAKRGLPAYIHSPELAQAALEAAKRRASRLIEGHLPESDFTCLASGAHAEAAGCAAWEPSWGWGSCCTYDNYTYAGAAWVMGSDGRRYMHLFVR